MKQTPDSQCSQWGTSISICHYVWMAVIKSLRPRQNGRHFPDDIFKCIFLNENMWICFEISLKFVPKGLINNIPALVQIMTWRRPGDEPLSEPMSVCLLTHICGPRPQWVKSLAPGRNGNFACHSQNNFTVRKLYDNFVRLWLDYFSIYNSTANGLVSFGPLCFKIIDLFHSKFSPNGLQPEHRKLAHEL